MVGLRHSNGRWFVPSCQWIAWRRPGNPAWWPTACLHANHRLAISLPFPTLWLSSESDEALLRLDGSPWPTVCHFRSYCICKFLSNSRWRFSIIYPWISFLLTIAERFVPTHLKSIIACTAVAHGGKKEWDFAHFKFNTSNSATEKDDMLEAMSCSNQAWILKRCAKIKIFMC